MLPFSIKITLSIINIFYSNDGFKDNYSISGHGTIYIQPFSQTKFSIDKQALTKSFKLTYVSSEVLATLTAEQRRELALLIKQECQLLINQQINQMLLKITLLTPEQNIWPTALVICDTPYHCVLGCKFNPIPASNNAGLIGHAVHKSMAQYLAGLY